MFPTKEDFLYYDSERYNCFFQEHNWFFASNSEMFEWAKKQSFLKPLYELINKPEWGDKNSPKASNWFYAYVPKNFTIEDLPKIFTYEIINFWGIHELNLDYSI